MKYGRFLAITGDLTAMHFIKYLTYNMWRTLKCIFHTRRPALMVKGCFSGSKVIKKEEEKTGGKRSVLYFLSCWKLAIKQPEAANTIFSSLSCQLPQICFLRKGERRRH